MDLAAIESALRTLVTTLTGVDVVQWENEPRKQHNGRLVLLSWVSTGEVGPDSARWEFAEADDPLDEMTPIAQGHRLVVLQVSCETHDQRAGSTARALAETLRARLVWPRATESLLTANLGLVSVGPVTPSDYRVDQRMVSRCLVEIRLNATSFAADADGRTSTIQTVGVTGTLVTPSGTAIPASIQPSGDLE